MGKIVMRNRCILIAANRKYRHCIVFTPCDDLSMFESLSEGQGLCWNVLESKASFRSFTGARELLQCCDRTKKFAANSV